MWLGDLLDRLNELDVHSGWSYLVAFVVPAGDAVLPVLPSETAVITLGVTTSGDADPRIVVLLLLAALGAFAGDNLSYFIGRRYGPWAEGKLLRGEKGQKAKAWAEKALQERGSQVIVVCRFIPGGRTAVTLTCGLTGFDHRRFMGATAVAALIWATYCVAVGRFGGKTFEDNPLAALGLAFGIALAVSLLVEVIRWSLHRRAASRKQAA